VNSHSPGTLMPCCCAGRPSFSCFAAQNMKATVNGVVIAESSACEVMPCARILRTLC